MKIKVSRLAFMDAYANLTPFISKNPAIPVLENALMDIGSDGITLKASDGQSMIEFYISGEEYSSDQELSICINIQVIGDYLENIDDEFITFEFTDNSATVFHDGGQFDTPTEEANIFPNKSIPFTKQVSEIDSVVLINAIKSCQSIMSTPDQVTMQSDFIYITPESDGMCYLSASDSINGRSVMIHKIKIPCISDTMSIYINHANLLVKYLKNTSFVKLSYNKDFMVIEASSSKAMFVLGNNKPLNFVPILEMKPDNVLSFDKSSLLSALERCSVPFKKYKKSINDDITFNKTGDDVTLTQVDNNVMMHTVESLSLLSECDDFNFSIPGKVFGKAIKSINADVIMINELKQGLIMYNQDKSQLFICGKVYRLN